MASKLFSPVMDASRLSIPQKKLLRLLIKDALGELDEPLTMGRRKSIEILLKKCLPDLTAVTIQDENGKTVPINFNITL
jgi:hypothetical protein